MKRYIWTAVLLLLLSGCSGEESRIPDYAPTPEEKLVIYTSHKEAVYGPIIKEFEERSGLWVQVVTGGTNELLERIEAEQDAPVCDVMFGGGAESLSAYADCFEAYAPAAGVQFRDGVWHETDFWVPFSTLPVVMVYNTRLVREGELCGWQDLLSGQWEGKIALADPTISGSGYTAVLTMLSSVSDGLWEGMDQLQVQLQGKVLQDSGDVVREVANGAMAVGLTLEETALKWQAQGAALEVVYPEEGTSAVPDGGALVAGAPHADNAKRFLDFIQSRDVQMMVSTQMFRRSVRKDVETPGELPELEEITLIPYDVQWAGEIKQEFVEQWSRRYGERLS